MLEHCEPQNHTADARTQVLDLLDQHEGIEAKVQIPTTPGKAGGTLSMAYFQNEAGDQTVGAAVGLVLEESEAGMGLYLHSWNKMAPAKTGTLCADAIMREAIKEARGSGMEFIRLVPEPFATRVTDTQGHKPDKNGLIERYRSYGFEFVDDSDSMYLFLN